MRARRYLTARITDAAQRWRTFTEAEYLAELEAGLDRGAIDLHIRIVCPCNVCRNEPRRAHTHIARRSPNGKVWHNLVLIPNRGGMTRAEGKIGNGDARRLLREHAKAVFQVSALDAEHVAIGARLELGTPLDPKDHKLGIVTAISSETIQ